MIESVAMRRGEGNGCGVTPVTLARSTVYTHSIESQSYFAIRKEGCYYNETATGLSIKCVCMSFSSILSVVFTFTCANVSILTFLFVISFNYCRMGRRLRLS